MSSRPPVAPHYPSDASSASLMASLAPRSPTPAGGPGTPPGPAAETPSSVLPDIAPAARSMPDETAARLGGPVAPDGDASDGDAPDAGPTAALLACFGIGDLVRIARLVAQELEALAASGADTAGRTGGAAAPAPADRPVPG